MDKYVINDSAIALIKSNSKTIVINVDNQLVINKNIKFLINYNCLIYGSDLDGREEYIKKIIGNTYKKPIIINKSIILIQINSFRNSNTMFINLNKIINYKEINNKLIIKCINNNFVLNISKYSLEKEILIANKVCNIINSNYNNFV